MIDYRQAQEMILQRAHSFGKETVALEQAMGRVLAETIRADREYPPFDRASMDGFAVRFADLENGIRRFAVVETLFAGSLPTRPVAAGECYKIMTGAAVPGSVDIIIRRENVAEGQGMIQLPGVLSEALPAAVLPAPADPSFPWKPFQNIARKGEDLTAGAVVIDGPCACEPAIIGLLATLGHTTVTVQRLPRIGVLTTGDEVVAADAPVSAVQIRNSNRWLLEAALKKTGVGVAAMAHAPDDPVVLRQRIEELLVNDVLIVCGGVSAGDADYVPGALEAAGVRKLFHKVAMRPGKPVWCGATADGKMVFALPGNPFSCLVNMVLLIRPYLQACYGLRPEEPLGLALGAARKKRSPLDEFFPVCLHGSPARLTPVSLNGSGDIRLGMQANALALHSAASGDLPEGASVLCYSFV
ncbi:molybdopterin molybdotransferase MoeA [Puia dinghuensis]|uniref:Molybdopterin molybdenumtransferase n=1 Tax=Puia dinghuensis TaxID=1792502 RepID=A0A8J2U9J9_9BACT|nr:molybdopterin molybdotransferase MoeA [Puia dinghuensis]GGA87806.1 molybdopterin molybdenumtransferase MoeA [Puia dinghuensis]